MRVTYECAVLASYSNEEFLRAVAHEADLNPLMIPQPHYLRPWHALAGSRKCFRISPFLNAACVHGQNAMSTWLKSRDIMLQVAASRSGGRAG